MLVNIIVKILSSNSILVNIGYVAILVYGSTVLVNGTVVLMYVLLDVGLNIETYVYWFSSFSVGFAMFFDMLD